MEKRRLGRTEHQSTVAIFGAAAFSNTTQEVVDGVMEQIIAAGVNHIDVAPGYGMAEKLMGPWIARERERFFLGCKTTNRDKESAAAELRHSLKLLRTDRFDLFQFHAVTTMEELDQITGPGGALEAVIEARDAGLTKYIGITGHGFDAPRLYIEALNRFDFDTVMFPLNFVQMGSPVYRGYAQELLRLCKERDVAAMIIKSLTRRPWGDREQRYATWYEPFDEPAVIQEAINYALSQDVTGLCTTGDVNIIPMFLEACENFTPLSKEEQEAQIAEGVQHEPLFAEGAPPDPF